MTNSVTATSFTPLRDNVFIKGLESGPRRSAAGIIIPGDDMKDSGIRDRWAEVAHVGPEVDDLVPGDWVLVKHGRWTPGIDLTLPDGTTRIWRIDYPEAVILAADHDPRPLRPTTL